MKENKLLCPITGDELVYVGYDKDVCDGNSYYSPINDKTIIFAVHPFRRNIYAQVESQTFTSKELRYFKLLEGNKWLEMKKVPHGDVLFPKRYYGSSWKRACAEAKLQFQKRLEKEKYWKEHPEEDPRYFARTISNEEVKVAPLSPPSGMLFYLDYSYKKEESETESDI
jgi:hypothetical protein